MKLMVSKHDNIAIKVFCWEQDGEVEASHQKSDVPQNVDVVEIVEFIFRKPNYADSNVIIRNSNLKTEGEETSLNVTAFQEQILKSLLVDWDMKDDEENKIPVNAMNINNLIPAVARASVAGCLDRIKF